MHFRPFDADLTLGTALPNIRDDLLGIVPHSKESEPFSASKFPKLPGRVASIPPKAFSHSDHAEGEPRAHIQAPHHLSRQVPKRVSFTSEERLIAAFDDNESDDGNRKAERDESVAAILRGMSQLPCQRGSKASSSGAAADAARLSMDRSSFTAAVAAKAVANMRALGSAEQEAALVLAGKRSIPTSFYGGDGAAGPIAKRVRWLPPGNNFQDSSARFFHRMPRRASTSPPISGCTPLPVIPVLKPVPGLHSYDVLIGRDFISHFNLGNRRLLVLALPYAQKYAESDEQGQQDIIESLYSTMKSAGGRFVQMHGQTSGYDEAAEEASRAAIAQVLIQQHEQITAGTSLLGMFQRNYSFMWGGDIPQLEVDDDEDDQKPAAVTSRDYTDDDCSSTSDDSDSSTSRKKPIKKMESMTPLGPSFKPGPFDVICSRGSVPKKHPGNQWFLNLVEQNCERYTKAQGKMGKSIIVSEVLDVVRKNSPGGGFVKLNDQNQWCETGDHLAREKIGQCFRDRLHTKYSSSSKAKLEKRRHSRTECDSSSVGSTDESCR